MGFCVLPGQIFSHPDSSPSWTPIMQIVVHLMLSQRSLKLSLFLFILFSFCSATEVSITLSSSSLTHSSESFSLLLIPSSVFFHLVMLFFISIWLLFIFSNSVKNFYLLALCFYGILPSFVIIWTPSQVDCLSPYHLVLLGFYLVPSSEICSSAASLCLSFCLHVYVCGRLVTFLDLGEVAFCRRCPVSQQCLPFSSPKF